MVSGRTRDQGGKIHNEQKPTEKPTDDRTENRMMETGARSDRADSVEPRNRLVIARDADELPESG